MDLDPLLLGVWREVGRQGELASAFERIAPLLRRQLRADDVLLRRLDLAHGLLETVATAGGGPGPAASELSGPALRELAAWCRRGRPLHGPAGQLRRKLPGALPDDLEGDVLLGPLAGPGDVSGVLVLAARPPRRFARDAGTAMRALLEPFATALENERRRTELEALRESAEADRHSLLTRLGRQDLQDTIVGIESGLRASMERIELVAPSDVPVLLLGETGSGKEVAARTIHQRSPRASGPFLRVNCGAIPAGLIDSELFGHERGSFTGADRQRKGWFERADGGTLFLDEVGELPAAAQVRLLRILQDGTFERVGGSRALRADVRIVAATHRDLHAMVAEGRFREDLWYRLAVFVIHLPPLRDRPEDIPALAGHFAQRAATRFGLPARMPSPEDVTLLAAYAWPGNVRELASVMDRAVLLGQGRSLEIAKALGPVATPVPEAASSPVLPAPAGAPATLDAAARQHIEAALARAHGRIEGPFGAALALGINPHTLRARMRKLGIDWRGFRAAGRSRGQAG
jgi:transcriptional regulator with GAF, ATPase, and Fis domain